MNTHTHTRQQLIPTSSQWYDKLRAEIKYFEDINIDIDKLMNQNRESDKIRGQMAVLERRVQVSLYKIFMQIFFTSSLFLLNQDRQPMS